MCLAGSVTCAVTGPLPNGHRLSDKGEGRGVCVVGCSNEEGGGAVSGSVEGLFMDPHREPLVLVFVTFTHTLLNRWPII